jgi:hypothetical protein
VPFDLLSTARPLVVQLRVVETCRRAEQVDRDVGRRPGECELGERRVEVGGAGQAPQAWIIRCVIGLDVDPTIGCAEGSTLVDEFGTRRPEPTEPVVVDRRLDEQVATLLVRPHLLARQ